MVKFDIGDKIKEAWKKDLPSGVDYNCDKHVTDSMLACRNYYSNPTLIVDCDLQHVTSHSGDYGHLRAGLPGGRLLYARRISKDNYSVDIYQLPQHHKVATLTRPGQPYKSEWISASQHPHSQWLAVLDGASVGSHTLDIYNDQYQHQTHIDLRYVPRAINGVAAVKDYFVVVDWNRRSLRVYNWAGRELCVLDRGDLGIGEDYIRGIGGTDQHRLVLAAGPGYGVTSLHLYDVV